MKNDILIRRGLLPFILLLVALATTFYLGNTLRIALFCLVVMFFLPIKQFYDKDAKLITAFLFFYTVISYFNGIVSGIVGVVYTIMPALILYLFGCYIGKYWGNNRDLLVRFFLLVIVSFASYIYINLFANIQVVGSLVNADRIMVSSSQDVVASATMIGLYTSLGLIGLPIFLFDKGWSWRRLFFLVAFIFSLMATVFLVNRTGLVTLLLVTAVAVWYNRKKQNYRFVFLLTLIAVFIIGYFFSDDLSSVFSAYAERNSESSINSGGDRFHRWKDGLIYLFLYPTGWAKQANFAHNMWLDVSRDAGIIPFFFLFIITIRYIKLLSKFINNSSDALLKTLFVSLFTCFVSVCSVEPVIEGEILYLGLFFMTFGVIKGLMKNTSVYERNR